MAYFRKEFSDLEFLKTYKQKVDKEQQKRADLGLSVTKKTTSGTKKSSAQTPKKTSFQTQTKNAYNSAKEKTKTKTTITSDLTDEERNKRIKEINSELNNLKTKLVGYSRAATYGTNKAMANAKKKDEDRIAELTKELTSLKRVGTFSASELKQFEIEDAKKEVSSARQKVNSFGTRPTAASAESYKKAVSDQYNAQQKLNTLKRQKTLYEDITKYGDVVNEEGVDVLGKVAKDSGVYSKGVRDFFTSLNDFESQWRANYRSNELSREADKAMSKYLNNPTEENKQIAYAYDAFVKEYMKNNEKALDDENVKASWLTKSMAGYLPQFKDQIVPEVIGGTVGALVGGAVGAPSAGMAIGSGIGTFSQSYDTIRGSVYRTLLAEGVDEEIARDAANDEALVSSLIESGETAVSWLVAGGGKALSAIGGAAQASVAKGSTNAATKFVAGLATKASTKATNLAASKAAAEVTKPLWSKGLRVAVGIVGNGASEYLEEFTQGAVSEANREKALASIDKEIGQYGGGNIDLYNRPIYKNSDGTISTVDSVTYEVDGKYVVLPTIVRDEKGNAKRLTDDEEIINHYLKTGEYLGKFDSQEEADAYAQKVHSAQAYYYDDKNVAPDDNLWSGGAKVIKDAVFGGDKETLAELHAQGWEGAKIGLMFGGSNAVVNNIVTHYANAKTVKIQNEVIDDLLENEKDLKLLIESGKASGTGTVSERIATEIETAKANGKEVTREQVKQLLEANEVYKNAEVTTSQPDPIEEAAKEVVNEKNRMSGIELLEARKRGEVTAQILEELTRVNAQITNEEAKKVTGFGVNGAELVAKNANVEGATFYETVAEVRPSYIAGFNNPDLDIKKVAHTFDTQAQQDAYTAGQKDAVMQNSVAEAKAKNARVFGAESGVVLGEHSQKYTPKQIKMSDTIGKDLGSQVSFEERLIANYATKAEANAWHQDGEIKISNTSDNKFIEDIMEESLHRISQINTEAARVLIRETYNFVVEGERVRGVEGALFDAEKALYDNAGESINTRGIIEEVSVGELSAMLFRNEKEWNRWRERLDANPELRTAWQKLMDAVLEIIEKIRRLLAEGSFSKEARAKVNKDLADLERFRSLYADAYIATRDAVAEKTNKQSAETTTEAIEEPTARENNATNKETPAKTEKQPQKEISTKSEKLTDKTKNILSKNVTRKVVGVKNGQAYISDSRITIPIEESDVAYVKSEWGLTDSDKVVNSVEEILNNEFVPISTNPVEGNLVPIKSVYVFTTDDGRQIAIQKKYAKYFEGYNLSATFVKGKPYAIKATDANGNLAGLVMAIRPTRGSYELTDIKDASMKGLKNKPQAEATGIKAGDIFVADNGIKYKILSRDAQNTTVEISSEKGSKTMVIANEVADNNFSNIPKEGITKWIDEDMHIDNRTWEDVGSRSIKAFQFLFPEMQEYYRPLAQELLWDLDNTVKGERMLTGSYEMGNQEWTGVERITSDAIATIKDSTNATYDDIRNALNRLINDEGQENIALAKRIELVLDGMLTDGYNTFDGTKIPPNEEYIAKKEELIGKTYEGRKNFDEWNDDLPFFSLKGTAQKNTDLSGGDVKFSLKNTNLTIKSKIPFTTLDGYITVAQDDDVALDSLESAVQGIKRGTYTNDATGYSAKITGDTINKAIRPARINGTEFTEEHIRNLNAMIKLPELFKKAVYVDSKPPQKVKTQKKAIKEYHHFVAPVLIGNDTYRALITAREKINSNTLYVLQVEVLPMKKRHTPSTAQQKAGGSRLLSVPSSVSIPELVKDVKIYNYDTGITDIYSGKDIKFSLKDQEYLELAKDPKKNEARLRELVDEAAKEAGYIGTYYHGSKSDFTVFKKEFGGASNSNASIGFWFTETEEGARKWADNSWWGDNEQSKVYKTYLRLNNPKVYETVDTKAQREELKRGYENIDKEMTLYDSIYYFEDGRRYHNERYDYDKSKRRSASYTEWEAFKAIVKKYDADHIDYCLEKIPEGERQIVKQDAERYLELSKERKALENQITELRYSDAYELFRTDMYKQIGLGAEDANIGGTGKYVDNKDEMLKKYVDMLKQQGYEGIIIKGTAYDTSTFGENNNQYLVFDSNQAKSAEPVTYDDNGNIIPLSERFNKQNDDIRYSLKDSEGKTLTEAQAEYFKDSKIRDENGNLLVVYHGSPAKFTVFNHNKINAHGNAHGRGFYFTEKKSFAEGYEREGGQLLKGYLNIANPLSENKVTIKKTDLLKLIKATCREQAQEYVRDEGYDSVNDALRDTWISNYVDTYNTSLDNAYREVADIIYSANTNDVEMVAELTNSGAGTENTLRLVHDILGYDGVIYENEMRHEFVSLVSNQFKSVDNTNPTVDPDINYSLKDIKEKYAEQTDHLYIYEKKNTISIDNMVVKKEYRNQGIGTAILNDVINYADQVQKIITLTPTSEFGTKERLKKWYKANGFVENKGRNTDFTISDTMYRLPSSTSFSLKGGMKGTELFATLDDLQKGKKGAAEKLSKYVDSGLIRTELYDELIEKYGAIHTGEKPSRDVQVPRKSGKNKKVSQTVRTILEAQVTPDEAVPTIEKMVEDGIFSYDVYTDKQAIENGEDYIEKHGWEQSLIDWFDAVNSGEVSKDITTTGWILYNHAANAGDAKTAIMILDAMVRHQRSAAQALQATRILKSLSPETQLYGVQKSVEAFQEELIEKYGDKAPDLQIDSKLAESFLNAETQEERDKVAEEIYKDIGRQMPSRFIDKWNAWRYLAMLGNARTHVRNILGNAFFAPVVGVKNLTATAIESTVYRVSGKKTVRGKAIVWGSKADRALLKAAWSDYANVSEMISNGGKYNDSAMTNQSIEEGRRIFKFKPLEWARKTNSNLLEKEDTWFSQPHYAYALAQYCKANNITAEQIQRGKAIAPARDYAIKEAQKATYRDTNAFSQFISDLGRYGDKTNPVAKGASIVLDGILPFRKTPANILVRGIEYSPIGLIKSLSRDLRLVSKGEMTSSEAIDNISSGLTGTGLLALGVFLAAQGLVRGHGEDEDDKEFKEMLGHQSYALELPNGESITLDWLAPEALPFFVGVNVWETTKGTDEEVNLSTILQSVSHITEPMLEMSCLQGINDLFEGIGYASSNDTSALMAVLSSAATSYITQGIPTLFGQIERTGEEERMTTYTEKNDFLTGDMQYTLGKVSAKIPYWDYNQIPYIDAWGRKEASGTALKRGLNNFLNPAYTSTIESSSMEKELLRLYEITGEATVFPERADKYFYADGERKDLTAEEYVKYATLKGENSYKLITDLINSDAYKKLTDKEKVDVIEETYDYANQKAKQAISNFKPQKWVEKADEFAPNVGNYISYKNEVNSTREENGGKITKQEIVDIIIDMAQNDSEIWKMYLSEYDYEEGHKAKELGIDAETYIKADTEMYNTYADYIYNGKRVDGKYLTKEEKKNAKLVNGSKKQKIIKYLNSVCTNERDYMFLLGTEYDSVLDDYDYVKYFGK